MSFFSELKKRKVYRTAAAYAVVAFVIMQIIEIIFPMFGIPDWAGRMIIILLFLGLPITIVFSWMYDVGEEGVTRAKPMMVGGEADTRSLFARKRSWFFTAGLAMALILGYQSSGTIFGYKIGGPTGDDKSIAVLPFDNFSKDKDDKYLSDGITEDITMNLAKVKALTVISRTSVMGYKGSKKKIKDIAKELGVKYILEGSVRMIGDRVRIVGQLIDAPNDKHIWANSYDRDLEDLFDIQADVSKEIANAMEAELTDKTVANIEMVPTDNMEAYILLQRARTYYGMYTEDGTETAIQLFKDALAMDPNYAEAYAGLSDSYAQRFIRFGYGLEWVDSSLAAADKSIEINPNLADGYKAKGLAYMAIGNYQKAGSNTYRAIEINPGYHMAIANYGIYNSVFGNLFEAHEELMKSKRLNPTSTSTEGVQIGFLYYLLGENDIARENLLEAHTLSPNVKNGYISHIKHELVTGNYENVDALFKKYEQYIGQDNSITSMKGMKEFYNGNYDKSGKILSASLKNLVSNIKWGSMETLDFAPELYHIYALHKMGEPYQKLLNNGIKTQKDKIDNGADYNRWMAELSALYAIKGETETAIKWLEKAVKYGYRDGSALELGMFDNIRNHDRFKMAQREIDLYIQEERIKFIRAGLID
ncbi:MAG: hypothetical protein QGF89_05595 [Candidatus Marinimicrobia bacterium]|jgi:TolB-like protein|nr:hypothetical protein [Candidatus Neomarinimicrobiota bacterium]MDP6992139.1 hypothetical protein [Candidatus Neomarinimicrobiota bacterium]